jgi:prevent-host-death family protein
MDLEVPLARARAQLPELCRRVQEERVRIVLTKYGTPVAAIVSVEEVSGLQKSLPLAARRTPRSRRHAPS